MSTFEMAGGFALAAVIVVICALLYHLLMQNGRLLLRLEALEKQLREQGISVADSKDPVGLPSGTVVHDFSLPLLTGETARLSQWRGQRVLLVFIHPQCSFSEEFLTRLSGSDGLKEQNALFVSGGKREENQSLFERLRLSHPVFLQEDSEVSSLFKIPGTPSGYVLDEHGSTAGGMLVGVDALLRGTAAPAKFTRALEGSKLIRDGLSAGTKAPDFTLPTLQGTDLSLNAYLGKKVLLVFSDPQCAPCNRVAPDLEKIHRRAKGPQILMVSRGTREANEAKVAELGLSFPVVLQRHWEVSRAYGMFATPIGYLIDEKGVLASGAAVGADSILELSRT